MHAGAKALREDVTRRLRCGQNMVLYGPRGSGKSTLLLDLEERMRAAGIACGRVSTTRSLADVTQALEAAYPAVVTSCVNRRTARSRLWHAADLTRGVLLLDHVTRVTDAMVGFLRRLRGGLVGVLAAVDVEVERERQHLRPWRLGALSIRMPPMSTDLLRRLLREDAIDLRLPDLPPEAERRLLRAARGRPGWIRECVRRQTEPRYWLGSQLLVAPLATDTEISLRQGRAMRVAPPCGDLISAPADRPHPERPSPSPAATSDWK